MQQKNAAVAAFLSKLTFKPFKDLEFQSIFTVVIRDQSVFRWRESYGNRILCRFSVVGRKRKAKRRIKHAPPILSLPLADDDAE